ncbi:2-isopropylmalate synthase [candidate division FCPU426 bacterium]|nr:2-isopropylmalate synthase [candidate division FCPU426 bacterium]
MPYHRYSPYPVVALSQRTWPDRTIRQAPIWCSVDLRDGNQALRTPMKLAEKTAMFELLLSIGFKEIEVGFPAASTVEYGFIRSLIEEKRIPEDVVIQVLTPARLPMIEKTFSALQGAKRVIVHLYHSTSALQRRVVFNLDKQQVVRMAKEGASCIKNMRNTLPGTTVQLEYSPESFTGTELDFGLDICRAVMDIWQPDKNDPMIINLPATVEMSTPNVYADRIEWFGRHLGQPDAAILSVHTHNDRGTAVAAAELALLAGAQRVEGTLFGNGERTGNADLITLALNLFSQGVDPELDFSCIDTIKSAYEKYTRMPVPDRHPYAGALVYTAFSGSHQDAIHKGMKAQQSKGDGAKWEVPYLPIDPRDVGRSYESIIRINSQSGKGGAAFILEKDWGFSLPKNMQPEFGQIVQARTEASGNEISSQEVFNCFRDAYLATNKPYCLESFTVHSRPAEDHGSSETTSVAADMLVHGKRHHIQAQGNGPVDALMNGLNCRGFGTFALLHYSEHALKSGSDAEAVAYVQICADGNRSFFGVGIDHSISTAAVKAVISALNRQQ